MGEPSLSDDSSPPELDPNAVQGVFSEAEEQASALQKAHLEAAQHAGYARAAIHAVAPFYVKAAEISEDVPEIAPFVASGVRFVSALGTQLRGLARGAESFLPEAGTISGSVATLVTTSDSTSTIFTPGLIDLSEFEAPPFFAPNENTVFDALHRLDPPLANTYREVGQAFHATSADPGRAAIALMRQTLDHFFDKLAPDDKVRASSYWSPKGGSDPQQVTRRERMTYAAHTHIKDPRRALTIAESIDVVLEAYQFLHKLHKRGALSEKQANKALRITKSFLEAWAAATTP